jgi:tripartite-type tricarboxylate transporter receptor subunit TctC
VPKGTPPAIVEKLSKEIAKIHDDKEFREKQLTFGMKVYPKAENSEQILKRMADQSKVFADIIKAAGVSQE